MKSLKKLVFYFLVILLMANGPLVAQTGQPAGGKAEQLFQAGKDAIHKKDWSAAVEQWKNFSTLFPQSQWGAEPYYWLAYSLNQAAKESDDFEKQTAMREQAMLKLEMLLKRFSDSSWASDARMLRIEVAEYLSKAGMTQYKKYITDGAESGNGSDMDVKLVALDALMQMDEEKALPILKKIIRENKDKNIRAKAVYVISQHDDPQVSSLLLEIARQEPDSYVREQAVFWLGQREDEHSLKALADLYAESKDSKFKEKIIFAISQHDSEESFDKLWAIAKNDSDSQLREKALFWMGQSGNNRAVDALLDIV